MVNESIILAAFIVLQTLSGDEVAVNTDQITSITRTRDGEGNKLLTERAECVIGMTNGKFFSVALDCADILEMIVKLEQGRR